MRKALLSLILSVAIIFAFSGVQSTEAHTGWHTQYGYCDYAGRYVYKQGYYVQQVSSWGYYDAGPYFFRTIWSGYYC